MCFVPLLFSFCFFIKLALANRVGGAKGSQFSEFKDNRHPSILEVQEWFEKPFTCYLVALVQFEPHFQIGPDSYVGSTILRLHKRQDTRIRQKFSLVVLPVAHMDTQRQIRTLEMTLIQRWNPCLSFLLMLRKRISKVGPDYSVAIELLAPDCTGS